MRNVTRAALMAMVFLTACSTVRDSRLNPFNWFGRDRAEAVQTVDSVPIEDRRPLVGQILSLNVDPTPEGAIIRAVGLPETQGYWAAELVEVASDNPSEVFYEFRIVPPLEGRRAGTQRSREVIAGTEISVTRLQGVRSVTVVGRQNRRSVRR